MGTGRTIEHGKGDVWEIRPDNMINIYRMLIDLILEITGEAISTEDVEQYLKKNYPGTSEWLGL
jgi:hypothetical protein